MAKITQSLSWKLFCHPFSNFSWKYVWNIQAIMEIECHIICSAHIWIELCTTHMDTSKSGSMHQRHATKKTLAYHVLYFEILSTFQCCEFVHVVWVSIRFEYKTLWEFTLPSNWTILSQMNPNTRLALTRPYKKFIKFKFYFILNGNG